MEIIKKRKKVLMTRIACSFGNSPRNQIQTILQRQRLDQFFDNLSLYKNIILYYHLQLKQQFVMTSIEITIEYCGHCGFGRTALAIQAIIQSSFGEQFEIYLTSTPRRTGLICIRYGKEDDGRILWKNNRKETEAKKDEIVAQVRNLLPAEAETSPSNSEED